MTTTMDIDTCYKQIPSIDITLTRICRNILPKIHDKVQKLTVDQSSMIPVLHAANYPQLYSLTIVDIQEEFLRDCLSNDVVLRDLLIKQITHLNIDIKCRMSLITKAALEKHLSTLKYFSLCGSLYIPTRLYDPVIVPLLSRMINLEKLKLCLRVVRLNSNYIDGNQLYDQFLCSMPKLKRFTFDIKTTVQNQNADIELSSHEQIQRSFVGKFPQQVFAYVNSNSTKLVGECHFYSLPYDFEYLFNVNNSLQGDRFVKVQQLRMMDSIDSIDFTYELFQRVAQNFPFLKYLCIMNMCEMKSKSSGSVLLTFPYLTYLDLDIAHNDYIVLFILQNHAYLPRLSYLSIDEKPLKQITNNFTINSIHFNFSKLKTLVVGRSFIPPENFHVYFPMLLMYE
ncbi:unnamed protein product [Adineta steineri]|uniref:Uncharacterized protein n=1 Tax=Adineta steineri TaxID=433720 RepID=A0A813UT41_9BILA|nr:unnamed protein product [Adineta steineri]